MSPIQGCCSTALLIQVHLSAAQGGAAGGFVPSFLQRDAKPCPGNLQPAGTPEHKGGQEAVWGRRRRRLRGMDGVRWVGA